MKYITLQITIILITIVVLSGCSKEDDKLSIPQASYNLLASGGKVSITINAKSTFDINIPENAREWLFVDEKSIDKVTLTYYANATNIERSVKLSVVSEDVVKYITLVQPIYMVSVTAIAFEKETFGLYQRVKMSATTNISDVKDNIKWTDKYGLIGSTNPVVYQPKNLGNNSIKAEIEINGVSRGELSRNIQVINCDFYFGIWGDTKEAIDNSEDGLFVSANTFNGSYGRLTDYLTRRYSYKNNKLVGGTSSVVVSYTSVNDARALSVFIRLNGLINELSPSFGAPTFGNYTSDMATKTNGYDVLYGYRKYVVEFKNSRTFIQIELEKGTASPYGLTYNIFYSPV